MYKILDRNEMFEGHAVPDWATAATHFEGSWYFEESLEQADGCKFQCIKSPSARVGTYGEAELRGFDRAVLFAPPVEQDDPLPPAPESVRYNDEYAIPGIYKTTWLDVKRDPHHVYLETGQYDTDHGVGMVLGPDAALQLAHDLNRMANEIKRKEKRNA